MLYTSYVKKKKCITLTSLLSNCRSQRSWLDMWRGLLSGWPLLAMRSARSWPVSCRCKRGRDWMRWCLVWWSGTTRQLFHLQSCSLWTVAAVWVREWASCRPGLHSGQTSTFGWTSWHFMRRMAAGCTADARPLYPTFMGCLSAGIFEWDAQDLTLLQQAKRAQLRLRMRKKRMRTLRRTKQLISLCHASLMT